MHFYHRSISLVANLSYINLRDVKTRNKNFVLGTSCVKYNNGFSAY